MLTSNFIKRFLLVATILAGIDWLLGVARFYYPLFRFVFILVNFPFSLFYLWLEKKPNFWWHGHFGPLVGDEVGQTVALLFMIICQAGLLTFLSLLLD